MSENIPLVLATIAGLGLISQVTSWWLKLPAILFLLLSGILIGPVLGWLDPNEVFGDLLFPFISLSVAVILFEGSLTLNFSQIKGMQRIVINFITIGLAVTWAVVTLLTHFLIGFDWPLSLLFGAIMVVTGPTVIVPMLRTIRLTNRIAQILRWEGILIDPIGAILTVLIFEYIIFSQHSGNGHGIAFLLFLKTLTVGSIMGLLAGYILGLILKHHAIPEYLFNVTTLTIVILAFVVSNHIAEESGLLTVTIMGVWLANVKKIDIEKILSFKEDLTILLVSALFIILAARIEFSQINELGIYGFFVLLGVQFIARPLKVFVSTYHSDLSWQEKTLLSWVAPRGIVAAAVTAVFAIKLIEIGHPKAELLVPLTFMIIIGTVVFQSATARPLANRLKVSEPEPHGFVIVGANPVARLLGQTLQDLGFRILLADTSWEKVKEANMCGLKTYFGDITSEHADKHLDLVGFGRLLALSSRDDYNGLAALRFKREFGDRHLFTLAPSQNNARKTTANIGRQLFSSQAQYGQLMRMLANGASIKRTKITEQFSHQDYLDHHKKQALILLYITPKQKVHIVTSEDQKLQPTQGWEIISLIEPNMETK